MATIYGYNKFNYPVTERVKLSAKPTVTNAAGSTNNPQFDVTMGLGRKDVGCIIDVSGGTGTVLASKPTSFTAGHSYYLLAEVPVSASADDFSFVGVPIRSMGDLNNLVARRPQQDWASQFANLRKDGAK